MRSMTRRDYDSENAQDGFDEVNQVHRRSLGGLMASKYDRFVNVMVAKFRRLTSGSSPTSRSAEASCKNVVRRICGD
jgi:hypothetical protein